MFTLVKFEILLRTNEGSSRKVGGGVCLNSEGGVSSCNNEF